MAFEDLMHQVGAQGRFQIFLFFYVSIFLVIIGSHFLIENFTAYVPEHRCWVPSIDNNSTLLNVSGNLNFSSLLKFFIPLDSTGKPEQCQRFSWPREQPLPPNITGQNLSQLEMEPCVDGWVYDQSIITSSIVTEWDLVCNSKTLKPLSQSILLAGLLVGFIIWGHLSDRFGRKLILSPSSLMLSVSGTCAAFAQSLLVYYGFRFLLGFSLAGVLMGCGGLVFEWTTSRYRAITGVSFGLSIGFGQFFLGLVAYTIQDWRRFQLLLSVPFFAFFLTSWYLPESPRWLIVNKKYDETLKVLRKVTKINGAQDRTLTREVLRSTMEMELDAAKTHYTLLDLLHFPNLCRRILCLSLSSFTTGMVFYGLSLSIPTLGPNVQMLQAISGAFTLVSSILCLFIVYCCGRRIIMVASYLFVGLLLLASVFVPQGVLKVVLTILGIGCIGVCTSISGIFYAELLPTVVRSKCSGFILIFDRMGAVLAPLVNTLKYHIPVMPQIIFGALTISSSLVIFFFLPETKNQPMPDTIQDVECREPGKTIPVSKGPCSRVPLLPGKVTLEASKDHYVQSTKDKVPGQSKAPERSLQRSDICQAEHEHSAP